MRHSMNITQSEDHIIGAYEINKISSFVLFWWQNIYSKYDGLGLGTRVN